MLPVILLFLAGVTLVFVEFFLPGAVLGILGGLLIVGSIILGWVRFPEYGLIIMISELVGGFVAMGLGLYLMSSTRMKNFLTLNTQQDKAEGYASPAESPDLVGKLATVQTALRPSGSITLDNRRIDAVSNGTFIDAGTSVRIVDVEGHRVVCEDASEAQGAD